MTTKEKLAGFLKAYAMHLKAVRRNDPFIASMDPPKPEDYGMHGPERWLAEKHAEKMAKTTSA